MHELMLFTDGSAQSGIGYGAYLALAEIGLAPDVMRPQIRVRRFEQTSSTRLELQTLLWALNEVSGVGCRVTVYTDSQNIMGLRCRRAKLEQSAYRSRNGRLLNNAELYREFFSLSDQYAFELVKVRGHQPFDQKDEINRIFTLVDRAARRALRVAEARSEC